MAGDYLALAWRAEDAEAAGRAGALARQLEAEGGWARAAATDRLLLYVPSARPPNVETLPHGAGFVIGDTYPTGDAAIGERPETDLAGGDPLRASRQLVRGRWGRYVAILQGPPSRGTAILRDPCGELDALVWSLKGGIEVIASDLLATPGWLRPPELRLNWDRIAAYVGRSDSMRMEVLFDGVVAVQPGTLQPLPLASDAMAVWRPGDFASGAGPEGLEAQRMLVARVDACTRALVERQPRVFMELSGGLDSAIVAGTLQDLGLADRVVAWLNYVADRAEGDERAYARDVTDRLARPLTVVAKPRVALQEDDFAEVAQGMRPALQGVDAPRDRDIAERMRRACAPAVLSGQGGDAVFFQMPSALVASDEIRRAGLRGLGSPVLRDVARRTRKSVWQVLAECRAAERRDGTTLAQVSPLVPAEMVAWLRQVSHPWLADRGAIPAAKQLQIQAIANAQLYRGDCRKRRAGDLLYPLLAQPVVELCLSIPARELAGGPYDRKLARAAFADRLPQAILERRSKGDLGSYYGRMIAGSLDFLRPYLLDGCLAGAGVLDRVAVERHLTPQALLRAPETGALLTAVAVEAWVRHWQGRVPDSASAPRRRR